MRGHDAILSSLGPRVPLAKADWNLHHRFALALSDAMQQDGVKRSGTYFDGFFFLRIRSCRQRQILWERLFFRDVVRDAAEMKCIFQKSDLDWTFVRPPRLTNRPQRGRFRVREGHLPGFGFMISRADVAAFMIKTAENHAFIRKVVGVSN